MINKILIILFLLLPVSVFCQRISPLNYKFNIDSKIPINASSKFKDLKVNNLFYKHIRNTPLKVSIKLGVNTDTFSDFIESEQDNDPTNDGIDFENLVKSNFRIFYQVKDISYFIGNKIIFKKEQFYVGVRFSIDLNYDNDDYEK